jgi:prepilin-type N-terminal cleavage/methylation domain-containing protein
MKRKYTAGFSLMELLVVVSIIAMLTAMGMVMYGSTSKNSRDSKRKADLEQLRAALVLYRTDNGYYPTSSASGTQLNFTTMFPIQSYITVTSMRDPKGSSYWNGGYYQYTTDVTNKTFSACAQLENPAGTQYCVTNP